MTLHPKVVTVDRIAGPYEAILLGVKSYALLSAMDDLAGAVGPKTTILPLLNGMSHVEALIARFGGPAILGGVCAWWHLRSTRMAGFASLRISRS